MARISANEAGGNRVLAFVDAIGVSELGRKLLAASDDGYDVLVGSTPGNVKKFFSYDAHPNVLVELTIHHADGTSSIVKSTAAGRYQILHRTAVGLKMKSFSPEDQDRACIELVRECKALPYVLAGDIRNAFRMCAKTWASLPGAGYNQHENKMDLLADAYFAALQDYADKVPT